MKIQTLVSIFHLIHGQIYASTTCGRLPVGDDGGLLHQALTSAQGWGDVRNLERIDKVGGPLQVSIHLP